MFLYNISTSTLRTTTVSNHSARSRNWRTTLFKERYSTMIKQNRYKHNNDVERSSVIVDSKLNSANTCMICFDKDLFGYQLQYASCGHNYCKSCLSTHYKTKILDGEVLNLQCIDPKCERKISENEITELVKDVDIQKKFYKFKKNALLQMDKNVVFCCKPNCDGYFYNDTKFYNVCTTLECNTCDTRMCWKCRQPFHGYILGCNQNIDVQYYKWALLRDVQECPNCRVKIEKSGGCNHMTCRRCHHQFCWICRGHYRSGHYNWSIKNLFGCPGGQNTWKFIRFPSWTPKWLNRIIMIMVLIPLLLFTGFIALIFSFISEIKYKLRYSGKSTQRIVVLLLTLMFIGSLIATLQWIGWINIWRWYYHIDD